MTPEARPASSGLIPAHAGKTPTRRMAAHCRWAHPRSRGENCRPVRIRQLSTGSSPLTRGKLQSSRVRSYVDGLIPAHAGKTGCVKPSTAGEGAHPRSRGENIFLTFRSIVGWGSSPLTRGKPFSLKSRHKQDAAHPRSRGENPYTASTDQDPKGSSPLTRGKRGERCHRSETSGLIPAHAGKTMTLSTKRPSSGAHPRSRGENSSRSGPGAIGRGSSPLTRGKRSPGEAPRTRSRLIPAHAGKTR